MKCPKYKDDTRTCIEELEETINFGSFGFCESNEYTNCPIYKLIKGESKTCKYHKECSIHFSKMPFEKTGYKTAIFDGMNRLCFSDKNKTCALYKLRKTNKNIPEGLLPNGLILEFNI